MVADYILFNVKVIFAYYVGEEFSYLHKWHLQLFNDVLYTDPEIVKIIEFHLLIDDINNEALIEEAKSNILNYIDGRWHDKITFTIHQNDNIVREGKVYKEEVIDKLDQYGENDLIIFMHTKGVTNHLNLENLENTMHWICAMYYFNFLNLFGIFSCFYTDDIIYYGALYNYDIRAIVKYKWQYVGSFHWLRPAKLLKYLNDKYGYSQQDISNHYLNTCERRYIAESFCGHFVEPEYAGFLNHLHYNKRFSHFLYEVSDMPYYNILYVLGEYVANTEYENYIKYFEKNKQLFNQKL